MEDDRRVFNIPGCPSPTDSDVNKKWPGFRLPWAAEPLTVIIFSSGGSWFNGGWNQLTAKESLDEIYS